MYFSNDLKKKILNNIIRVFTPPGYLFIGASETISTLTDDFRRITKGGIFYHPVKMISDGILS